jgi:hypothetical protein
MSDWAKILISALAGMVTGILLEPIRHWIGNKIAAYYAKRVIYAELGKIYRIAAKVKAGQKDPLWIIRQLDCEAFDFYYGSKREVLYLIPEYQGLISVFGTIHRLKNLHRDGEKVSSQDVEVLVNAIERRKEAGEIDISALRSAANRYDDRLRKGMAQIRAAKAGQ